MSKYIVAIMLLRFVAIFAFLYSGIVCITDGCNNIDRTTSAVFIGISIGFFTSTIVASLLYHLQSKLPVKHEVVWSYISGATLYLVIITIGCFIYNSGDKLGGPIVIAMGSTAIFDSIVFTVASLCLKNRSTEYHQIS